jgi:putative flippase GtrA
LPPFDRLMLSRPSHTVSIFTRYVMFAIVAGLMNLLTQALVFRVSPIEPLALSILAGTAVGFAVKYVLDKHWIFFDETIALRHEVNKVFLYGLFSAATTLVFWGFELSFLAIGKTEFAKYLGAVIGLAVGNFAKYFLDREFTFNQKTRNQKARNQKARSWK